MLFRKTRTLPFCYAAIRRSAIPRTASAGVQSIDWPVVAHPIGGRASAPGPARRTDRATHQLGIGGRLPGRSTPVAGFRRRAPRLPVGRNSPVPLDDCPGEALSPPWPGRRARSPARSKPNQPDRFRRLADVADGGLGRLNFADCCNPAIAGEGMIPPQLNVWPLVGFAGLAARRPT
jgi:hypothetical protein